MDRDHRSFSLVEISQKDTPLEVLQAAAAVRPDFWVTILAHPNRSAELEGWIRKSMATNPGAASEYAASEDRVRRQVAHQEARRGPFPGYAPLPLVCMLIATALSVVSLFLSHINFAEYSWSLFSKRDLDRDGFFPGERDLIGVAVALLVLMLGVIILCFIALLSRERGPGVVVAILAGMTAVAGLFASYLNSTRLSDFKDFLYYNAVSPEWATVGIGGKMLLALSLVMIVLIPVILMRKRPYSVTKRSR